MTNLKIVRIIFMIILGIFVNIHAFYAETLKNLKCPACESIGLEIIDNELNICECPSCQTTIIIYDYNVYYDDEIIPLEDIIVSSSNNNSNNKTTNSETNSNSNNENSNSTTSDTEDDDEDDYDIDPVSGKSRDDLEPEYDIIETTTIESTTIQEDIVLKSTTIESTTIQPDIDLEPTSIIKPYTDETLNNTMNTEKDIYTMVKELELQKTLSTKSILSENNDISKTSIDMMSNKNDTVNINLFIALSIIILLIIVLYVYVLIFKHKSALKKGKNGRIAKSKNNKSNIKKAYKSKIKKTGVKKLSKKNQTKKIKNKNNLSRKLIKRKTKKSK